MSLDARLAMVNDGRDLRLIADLIGACLDAGSNAEAALVLELEERALPPAIASQIAIKVLWRLRAIRLIMEMEPVWEARLRIGRSSARSRAETHWGLAKAHVYLAGDELRLPADCLPL